MPWTKHYSHMQRETTYIACKVFRILRYRDILLLSPISPPRTPLPTRQTLTFTAHTSLHTKLNHPILPPRQLDFRLFPPLARLLQQLHRSKSNRPNNPLKQIIPLSQPKHFTRLSNQRIVPGFLDRVEFVQEIIEVSTMY